MRNALLDDLHQIRQVAAEGRLEDAQKRLEELTSDRIALPGDHLQCAELAMELALLKVAERELQLELRDLRTHPEPGRHARALAASAEVAEALGNRGRAHSYRTLLAKVRGEPPPRAPRFDPLGASAAARHAPARTDVVRIGADPPDKLSRESVGKPRKEPEAPGEVLGSRPIRRDPGVDIQSRTRASGPSARASSQGLAPPATSDIARFLHLFAGRENVHARQWLDPSGRGGYSPVPKALTHELVRAHFAGTMTLGLYQTRVDGSVTFFALDLDATKLAMTRASQSPKASADLVETIAEQGRRMLAESRRLGLDLVLEDSGYKGRHLWGFLETPMAAGHIRNFVKALGRALAPNDERLALECFPKQEKLDAQQIGNLIKLPLGIHLKSGRRANLLDEDGEVATDPWSILAGARRHTHDDIMEVWSRLRRGDGTPEGETVNKDGTRAPAPLPLAPDFSEADLRLNPDLRQILGGCAVLRKLVSQGLETRRLNHDEQIVLRHTLGHQPIGIAAVNYVFRRCPEVGPDMYLKSVLAGHPISCPKIRKRIPEVTSKLPCNCHFGDQLDHYPTPNLHLRREASASVARSSPTDASPVRRPEENALVTRRTQALPVVPATIPDPESTITRELMVSEPSPSAPELADDIEATSQGAVTIEPGRPSELGKLPLVAQTGTSATRHGDGA